MLCENRNQFIIKFSSITIFSRFNFRLVRARSVRGRGAVWGRAPPARISLMNSLMLVTSNYPAFVGTCCWIAPSNAILATFALHLHISNSRRFLDRFYVGKHAIIIKRSTLIRPHASKSADIRHQTFCDVHIKNNYVTFIKRNRSIKKPLPSFNLFKT